MAKDAAGSRLTAYARQILPRTCLCLLFFWDLPTGVSPAFVRLRRPHIRPSLPTLWRTVGGWRSLPTLLPF